MGKICFMLLGNPPNNDTDVLDHWLKFIETIDNTTCIFINHPMERMNKEKIDVYREQYDYLIAFEKKLGFENMYICNNDDLTHIKTMWANISIVYAEIMMIQESIMKFGLAERYILLSNSCCPLYNYPTIYQTVMSKDKSWISIMETEPFTNKELAELYVMVHKPHLDKTSNIFNYYAGLKISQWMILTARHVKYMFSHSTLEQRQKTYLYNGELECNSGMVSKIKYNDSLTDDNCDKNNCIDDIKKLIEKFDDIINSELPNCAFVPYDEYAIQQFILNKILNNSDKTSYLTNETKLLNILEKEFNIMSLEYIKSNLEENYSKLNKIISNIKLDFYYNKPIISTLYPESIINKIRLDNYPSIIKESGNIIKKDEQTDTYNTIYLGKKFTVYPCYSISFSQISKYNYGPKCVKIVLNDCIFIGSTYTNWSLVTNNLTNYQRELSFRKTLSIENLEKKILENIFLYKNDSSLECDKYITYIKKTSPLYYDLKISQCLKKIYNSDVDLPDNYDEIIYNIKNNFLSITPPIPPTKELEPNYQLNEELRSYMEIKISPFFFLSEHEKDINLYPSLKDFLFKLYEKYKKNNCNLKTLNHLVLISIDKAIYNDLTTEGININYHPFEYYIMDNRENIFDTVSNYIKNIVCFMKEHDSNFNENKNHYKLENFIDRYKLPPLSIQKYGNPLDKYTLIPILLSGSLFVRKCVKGCSIDKFSKDLFTLDYVYKDYLEKNIEKESYFTKYLKYKKKYLQFKKFMDK
jgi:hypothetical protein